MYEASDTFSFFLCAGSRQRQTLRGGAAYDRFFFLISLLIPGSWYIYSRCIFFVFVFVILVYCLGARESMPIVEGYGTPPAVVSEGLILAWVSPY